MIHKYGLTEKAYRRFCDVLLNRYGYDERIHPPLVGLGENANLVSRLEKYATLEDLVESDYILTMIIYQEFHWELPRKDPTRDALACPCAP